MPSVRDILKGDKPSPDDVALQQGTGAPDALSQKDGDELGVDASADRSTAELIAERLRLAADQRAALAQGDIGRLEVRIDQLQVRLADLTLQNLPRNEVQADLEEAQERLEEAKADLTRAHEAKENTDLASSVKQAHLDHDQEFTHHQQASHAHGPGGTGATTVRSTMGKSGSGPAKLPGPARRKL